jgi:hypothetical protein
MREIDPMSNDNSSGRPSVTCDGSGFVSLDGGRIGACAGCPACGEDEDEVPATVGRALRGAVVTAADREALGEMLWRSLGYCGAWEDLGAKERGEFCRAAEAVATHALRGDAAEQPTDERLLWGVVHNAGRLSPKKEYRWAVVRDLCGIGSASAKALCRRFGLDPDEVIGGGDETEESDHAEAERRGDAAEGADPRDANPWDGGYLCRKCGKQTHFQGLCDGCHATDRAETLIEGGTDGRT